MACKQRPSVTAGRGPSSPVASVGAGCRLVRTPVALWLEGTNGYAPLLWRCRQLCGPSGPQGPQQSWAPSGSPGSPPHAGSPVGESRCFQKPSGPVSGLSTWGTETDHRTHRAHPHHRSSETRGPSLQLAAPVSDAAAPAFEPRPSVLQAAGGSVAAAGRPSALRLAGALANVPASYRRLCPPPCCEGHAAWALVGGTSVHFPKG